ncbi:MAG: ABC transporter ATP-binding protein/permease [Hydrogenibacillus schlegelii]|uniref:ABC transporter ATP-binding protein/permease n=1 Tax=Hydrogenibacillus schlegelii TaxID=1484 RepID=A0A947D0V6_HYDSH|nr:ABC transporter ATP-binding protein/permease [Hydrogenibacillus schlegelii]
MRRTFRHLGPFLRENRHRYAWGILFIFLADVAQLLTPRLIGGAVDRLAAGAMEPGFLGATAAILLVAAALTFLFRYAWRMLIFGTARKLEYTLRDRLFRHLVTLSPGWYDRHKVGDLMARATNDIGAVRFAFGGGVVMFFDTVILVALVVGTMIVTVDLRLTALATAVFPMIALLSRRFGREIHRRFKDVQAAFGRVTERVQENLSGVRVVRAYGIEAPEEAAFDAASRELLEKNLHLIRLQALFQPLVQLFVGIAMFVVLLYGGRLVLRQEITVGAFVAFSAYLMMLVWPMRAIGWAINILERGAASMERLNALFDAEPEIRDDERTDPAIRSIRGEIAARGLSFRYPGHEAAALADVSFTVPAGGTLGIIGPTGSGKSTLAALLSRLYEAPDETLFIDGRPIAAIPLSVLRSSIAVVPQEPFLFSATIEENLRFGAEDAAPEAIAWAVEAAGFHEALERFPDGLNTVVGERGVMLSGGEKQRLALARALLRRAPILILDDALSAVDARTERHILARLRELRGRQTMIIIAHRVSAVMFADEILVLDGGRIVERGSHTELMQKGGRYARLARLQSLALNDPFDGAEAVKTTAEGGPPTGPAPSGAGQSAADGADAVQNVAEAAEAGENAAGKADAGEDGEDAAETAAAGAPGDRTVSLPVERPAERAGERSVRR